MSAGTTESQPDQKNVVSSVLKACSLLECFSFERRELTLADLSEETGLNKTTAHRLLQTLVQAGWLRRGPSATYRLTMHVFSIGAIARADLSLHEEALPQLRKLAAEFGDTAYLMIRGEQGAICVDRVEGDSPIKVSSVGVGSVLPYHAAAGPMALLAWDDDLERRLARHSELERFTNATTVDVDALRSRLARIREDGYVVSQEDFLKGVSAVAAPVHDADGHVIATVSLGGTVQRFREPRLEQIVTAVCDAAAEVSQRLGYAG